VPSRTSDAACRRSNAATNYGTIIKYASDGLLPAR
jgi:hypothetical protein